jgi:hypothetical protein
MKMMFSIPTNSHHPDKESCSFVDQQLFYTFCSVTEKRTREVNQNVAGKNLESETYRILVLLRTVQNAANSTVKRASCIFHHHHHSKGEAAMHFPKLEKEM